MPLVVYLQLVGFDIPIRKFIVYILHEGREIAACGAVLVCQVKVCVRTELESDTAGEAVGGLPVGIVSGR